MNSPQKFKTGPVAFRPKDRRRIGVYSCVLLMLLLILPVYALSRLTGSIDWRLLAAVPVGISAFTFFLYRSDKQSAVAGEWRIPEAMLHAAELTGGWPGAFLAQRIVRHKISKISYQLVFWLIVSIHQFVALDSLMGWRLTFGALRYFKALSLR
jgi:uncharacterized membrane protein YsdA (DUF1294 family)